MRRISRAVAMTMVLPRLVQRRMINSNDTNRKKSKMRGGGPTAGWNSWDRGRFHLMGGRCLRIVVLEGIRSRPKSSGGGARMYVTVVMLVSRSLVSGDAFTPHRGPTPTCDGERSRSSGTPCISAQGSLLPIGVVLQ